MFPGPGAHVYYNDAGEPVGWDYPSDEPPELDEDAYWAHEMEDEPDLEHELAEQEAEAEELLAGMDGAE